MKKELHLVKTIENNRFLIHGKVKRLSGQLFAVFYFKIIDNGKDSGLLRYYNNTDTPFASQRTFYTLSPSLKVSLDEIKSFQFFRDRYLSPAPGERQGFFRALPASEGYKEKQAHGNH